MKTLARNQITIYYALYNGSKTPVVDTNGNKTGEYTLSYSNAVALRANVSAARGTADLEQFGASLNYSKTMVVDSIYCPIDESSLLWIGYGSLDDFSTSLAYYEGERVIHNGKLYEALENIPIGAWNATKWKEIKHNYVVASVAKSLNSISYAIREVVVS